MALKEVTLRDWWRVVARELPTGFFLGTMLGAIGFARILLWQFLAMHHWNFLGLGKDYGAHYFLLATTVFLALIGVVLFGSLAGSMLPFILRRFKLDPGERLGAVRRHARRCHRTGDLLHGCVDAAA